jgi:hypothetical protein
MYQQYKVDTDSIANWLATTAKDNGYPENTSSSNNVPVKSGRPKGKARKQAKGAHQPQPGNFANKTSRAIMIRDFEPMASYIAKIGSVKVPDHLTVALERVIWGT